MTGPFILSVEVQPGESVKHGFHLGTDERVARQIAEEKFATRVNWGHPTITVALMRDGKVFDVFDGRSWSSDY